MYILEQGCPVSIEEVGFQEGEITDTLAAPFLSVF